jgi:hypothetical protein
VQNEYTVNTLIYYFHSKTLGQIVLSSLSEDHVSGLRAEGVVAVLEQANSVGGDDCGELLFRKVSITLLLL